MYNIVVDSMISICISLLNWPILDFNFCQQLAHLN